MERGYCLTLVFIGSVFALAASVFASDTPVVANGWGYKIDVAGVDRVDNLARDHSGAVYATLELDHGRGKLVRIQSGKIEVIIDDLTRPDGLIVHGNHAYVTEEIENGRVLQVNLSSRDQKTLARVRMPEGIGRLADGSLVLTEDIHSGRLLRLDPNGMIHVLWRGLHRPEGLFVAKDQSIYMAETLAGRIVRLNQGKLTTIIDELNKPDQVALSADGSLWVTEDTKPGRLLLFKDNQIKVIASNLSYPQGILLLDSVTLLVSEQGEHRILRIFQR